MEWNFYEMRRFWSHESRGVMQSDLWFENFTLYCVEEMLKENMFLKEKHSRRQRI